MSANHSHDMRKTSRLRAAGPADLLALGPYLLGFEPTESVVVVAIHEGASVGAARCDLRHVELVPEVAAQIWAQLNRHTPGAHAVVMGYGEDCERVAAALQTAATTIEASVGSLMVDTVCLTDGHRWWTLTDEWEFDPAAGQPYDPCPPAVLQAVTEGVSVSGTRDDLERTVKGPSRKDGRAFASHLRRQERELVALSGEDTIAMMELLFRGMEAPALMSDEEQARLVVLVQQIEFRDEAWLTQTRASAEQHQVLWHHLVTRTPDHWAVPLLALLGFSAWLAGHGALANIACQRTLELDSSYRMAHLLDTILANGAHPRLWESMPAIGPDPAA